jgi:hypothetical protein
VKLKSFISCLTCCLLFSKAAHAYTVDCDPTGQIDTSMAISNYCEAPTSGNGGSAKNTENRIYSGFIWELFGDQGLIPQFIIGVRSLQDKDTDHVEGADASFRIKYQDKLSVDSLRLSYVGGKRDIMGNLGAGYSFSQSSWLATVAIQGSYVRLSTDYLVSDSKFRYYAELNTLNKPSRVMRPSSGGTCPSGYNLVPVTNGYITYFPRFNNNVYAAIDGEVIVQSDQIVSDKTCYKHYQA